MTHISLLTQRLAVCRLSPDVENPSWLHQDGFFVIARTTEELSIVCDEDCVPESIQAEKGWRILKVQGPLEFTQVGVLADIAVPLARAGVSIFAISTFDTDYVLVKDTSLAQAVSALRDYGHFVEAS